MQIRIKGRNVEVDRDVREYVDRRFKKIARQVSELAELEVELSEEKNPSISQPEVAEVTLYLKGVTLRAKDSSHDMYHAIHLCSDELARQVERHREKRRRRRDRESVSTSLVPEWG